MDKKDMAFAGSLLLLLAAVPAYANTNSDYAAQNDWCDGSADPDGIYNGQPTGDASSCDNDSEDATATSTYNGGVLTGCVNNGATASCSGGFIFNADTAFGAGSFGGDWPLAESIDITVTDDVANDATAFSIETTYQDVYTGAVATTTGSACIADGASITVSVGGGEAWDPPSGSYTITKVTGYRITLGVACALPGTAGVRTVAGDWAYTETNDMTANAGIGPLIDNGDGTCSFTWYYAADSAGRYGQATGRLDIDGGAFGASSSSGPVGGAFVANDEVIAGLDTLLAGEIVSAAASVWGIGGVYSQAQDSDPTSTTYQCISSGAPESSTATCHASANWDGGWVAGPLGSCTLASGAFVCATSGNTVYCDPPVYCKPSAEATVSASASAGNSQSSLACGGNLIAVADTTTAGFPTAVSTGIMVTGPFSCTFTFSPTVTTSTHEGSCSGEVTEAHAGIYSYGPVVIEKDATGAPYLAQSQPGCSVASSTATSMLVSCTPPIPGSWKCQNPGLIANADAGSSVTGNTWCTNGPTATATSLGGPVWSGIAVGVWDFPWYCEAIFGGTGNSGYVLCDAPDPPLIWPL